MLARLCFLRSGNPFHAALAQSQTACSRACNRCIDPLFFGCTSPHSGFPLSDWDEPMMLAVRWRLDSTHLFVHTFQLIMARRLQNPKRNNQRRSSLEILRSTIAPTISKTARAAAMQTKWLLDKATEVLKASVGEGPAVAHIHPQKARRNSRYSEMEAEYRDGW